MGITAFEIRLLDDILKDKSIKNVMELGSQNDYTKPNNPYASEYYKSKGIKYTCIDLAGDNNALKLDLAYPIEVKKQYDLVTDFGTSEHVVQAYGYDTVEFNAGIHSVYPTEVKDDMLGYYNCWLNKHRILKVGGIMVNVNPKTGNWPGHGYHYLSKEFYLLLEGTGSYKLLELYESPAMGNVIDGWHIYCHMKKLDNDFFSLEDFKKLPIFKK